MRYTQRLEDLALQQYVAAEATINRTEVDLKQALAYRTYSREKGEVSAGHLIKCGCAAAGTIVALPIVYSFSDNPININLRLALLTGGIAGWLIAKGILSATGHDE